MKKCRDCRRGFPVEQFAVRYTNAKGEQILNSYCRGCAAARSRKSKLRSRKAARSGSV